jgi:hypothetical protein
MDECVDECMDEWMGSSKIIFRGAHYPHRPPPPSPPTKKQLLDVFTPFTVNKQTPSTT